MGDERLVGGQAVGDNVKFLSMVDVTPWNIEKLLPLVVSVITRKYKGRTIAAVGFNHGDLKKIEAICDAESINVVRNP